VAHILESVFSEQQYWLTYEADFKACFQPCIY